MKHIFVVGGFRGKLSEGSIEQFTLVQIVKSNIAHKYEGENRTVVSLEELTLKSVLDAVSNYNHKLSGIVTFYEGYIPLANKLAEELSLSFTPSEAVDKATDKELMRQAFEEYDTNITPKSQEVSTFEQCVEFATKTSFPLIVKPANLVKSLLVNRVNNISELKQVFELTQSVIADVYKQNNITQPPKILLEEFMEGPVLSIDALIDESGEICLLPTVDYIIASDLDVNDNYHFARIMPSLVTNEEVVEIARVAKAGINAMSLKNSAAHIELIKTVNGFKIVEIGARPGGYRTRMYPMAFGIDYLDLFLRVRAGESLEEIGIYDGLQNAEATSSVAVVENFPDKNGKLQSYGNYDQIVEDKSVVYTAKRVEIGEKTGLAKDGNKYTSLTIIKSSDEKEVAEIIEELKNLTIEVATQ